jgi:uncharacterized membrane protein
MKIEKRLLNQLTARVLFFLIIISFTLPSAAREKDFYFPELRADLYVQKDGTFLVEEYLTFEFQGDFSWASLWIPLAARKNGGNSKNIEVIDFRVADEQGQLLAVETAINGERFEARWRFRASDERRTFHLSYRVRGAILDYTDISELFWQIIGSEVDRPTARAEILVHLPEGINNRGDLLVYGHGPLSGQSEIIDLQTVKFQAEAVPAHQLLEIRVVWPAGLVSGVSATGYSREKIIKEEERLVIDTINRAKQAREAAQRQKQIFRRLGLAWAGWQILGPLIWLLFYFYFWKKVGEDYRFDDIPEYYREIPSNLPPALVQVLRKQGGKPDPVALTATIFDLARRGYLEIIDEKIEKKGLFGHKVKDQTVFILKKTYEGEADLEPFEHQVLDLMFDRAGSNSLKEGARLSLEEFTGFLKKSPAEFQRWFQSWSKSLAAEGKERGFIEPASQRASQLFLLISLPLAFITISPVLIVLVLLLSPTLRRRRPDWARENELWAALERFLKDFSDFKEIPAEAYKLWDQYLVFGLLFGQAKRLVKMIPQILADDRAVRPGWLGGMMALSASSQNISSISAVINSIERTATAINQASLSAAHYSSGGGGGFSGGGGGGGGGGGVSAG